MTGGQGAQIQGVILKRWEGDAVWQKYARPPCLRFD